MPVKRLTIDDCQQHAIKRGGKCLSETYKNNHTLLIWECEFGHIWKAIFSNIYNHNKWCPQCSGNKKLTLEDAQKIAAEHNGKLLSTEYINSGTKLQWECKMGHIFWKNMNAINFRQSWCPYCSSWSSEEICRTYFETVFKTKFLKVRPKWLLNNKNNRMELDGLSQNIIINNKHIAFEHQGEQHYIRDGYISQTNYYYEQDLRQRKEDDELKIKLCKNKNIILIQIPQLITRTKLKDLGSLVKNELLKNKIDISGFDFDIKIDMSHIHSSDQRLEKIQEAVVLKGGRCISNNYVNAQTNIQIICDKGHLFEITPHSLQQGVWCKICNGTKRLTIQDAQLAATIRGGECLSKEYDPKQKLQWKCQCGYIWEASFSSIRNIGTWCPSCKVPQQKIKDRAI